MFDLSMEKRPTSRPVAAAKGREIQDQKSALADNMKLRDACHRYWVRPAMAMIAMDSPAANFFCLKLPT